MNPPPGFLETIMEQKRAELDAVGRNQRDAVHADALMVRTRARPHTFLQALAPRGRLKVIAEIKRSSPSVGVICAEADARKTARAYARAGAAAISVLTEQRYFHGSLKDLEAARTAVPLPLLRKDFVAGAHHIYEAAASGADAVLLIAAALTTLELRSLLTVAEEELEMDAVVEVHNQSEIERVLDLPRRPHIIGINNRNLSTLEVNRETTAVMQSYVQPGIVFIAESGFSSASELRVLESMGYDAVLMGSALMRGGNPEGALRELLSAQVAA